MMWLMNKFARNCMKSLFVEESGLSNVKKLLGGGTSHKVVFMPLLKSNLDYWVLTYVLLKNNLDLPFTFVANSEQPKGTQLQDMFRNSGFVF